MKWPSSLTKIRHDISQYNILKGIKEQDPLYLQFLEEYEKDPTSQITISLAHLLKDKFALGMGDSGTPLADAEASNAIITGEAPREFHPLPDIVCVSPYLRAGATLDGLYIGWPELAKVKVKPDERIREQEHGLALLYNDWRIFFALYPEQRELYEMEGSYYYRYPQGENVPDVRLRNNIWIAMLIREFPGKVVLVVTHHLNILATRANLEGLSAEEFQRLDHEEKPINLGVTRYLGHPDQGRDGRLILDTYNQKLY